jgi:hypothetical protein
MKRLAVLSTAALLGVGSIAASTTEAEARWRGGWRHGWHGHHHHRGGAAAAGILGGLAAGALIGAATNAYAYPAYSYGYPAYSYPAYSYYPAYGYGYAAPVAYYQQPRVVYRTRVVRRAPAYRTRVVHRVRHAPVYRTRVVHRIPAYSWGYAPAYYGSGVSIGFGSSRYWW